MNDYKAGDRVEYVGDTSPQMTGKVGTVTDPLLEGTRMVYVDYGGLKPWGCFPANLRHVPAPDLITIPRADLPEVIDCHHGLLMVDGSKYVNSLSSQEWRESANRRIAIAEFLDARERVAAEDAAAEKLAIDKVAARRDELVRLFTDNANLYYDKTRSSMKRAIDRVIELESP